LTPICNKPFVGWASLQTPLGELTALPRPLAVFRGPISKGKGGDEKGRKGDGREGDRPLPLEEKKKSRRL